MSSELNGNNNSSSPSPLRRYKTAGTQADLSKLQNNTVLNTRTKKIPVHSSLIVYIPSLSGAELTEYTLESLSTFAVKKNQRQQIRFLDKSSPICSGAVTASTAAAGVLLSLLALSPLLHQTFNIRRKTQYYYHQAFPKALSKHNQP